MLSHEIRRFCGALSLLALLSLGACVGLEPSRAVAAPRDTQTVVELVFGRNITEGVEVSDADWQRYVEEVLVRQTEGFTIADCQGGWLDGSKIMRERCKLVIVLADFADLPKIRDAVTEYRRRFKQQSVLWMERPCPQSQCRFEGL